MKSPVAKHRKEHGQNLVCLTQPKTIQEEDIRTHNKWAIIKGWYNEIYDLNQKEIWVDQAATSIMNAIVYQERKAFCITTRTLRTLLNDDANWEPRIGLSNKTKKDGDTYYSWLIAHLTEELEIIELVQKGEGKKPSVYKVIHDELLLMIDGLPMEVQIENAINYANKTNKTNDLDTGDRKGDRKGVQESKKVRNIEIKSVVENVSLKKEPKKENEKKATFKQLLHKQHGKKYPDYNQLDYLAQLAVENCHDFSGDSTDVNMFKRHLESLPLKETPDRKKFRKGLVKTFGEIANTYVLHDEIKDIEFRQPTDVISGAIKQDIDNEAKNQSHTLQVMLSSGVGENIKVLKRSLEKTENEQERIQIEHEINYWEKING